MLNYIKYCKACKLESNYLKNYFTIFALTYSIIILTKFIFIYYLQSSFSEFTLSQLLFSIFWGYKFDFATASIVALLVTFFDFNKKLFISIGSILVTAIFFIQMSDILYFNESSRHIGYEITDTITDASSLFMTAYSQHTILTISTILFGSLLFLSILKLLSKTKKIPVTKIYFLKKLLLIIITIFFIRGMTQHIPLNPWQSNQIGDTKLATLSLNATYNIIYALSNKSKKLKQLEIPKVDKQLIKSSFKQLYIDKTTKENYPLINTKPNVVFLFLESWSAKYLKPYGYKYNTTPYLNRLLKESIRPTIMIAGGHRTTEGMFVTLTSMQNPLGKSIAKTQLQDFQYDSIINSFNKLGYNSAFFQGTSKETSGTGSFAQSLGFKYSYGKRDVKKRIYEENYWGVHDIDLYNFVEKKLKSNLKEPFVIGINGATTHDDKIPKGIKQIDFTDDKINNQLNALHFADTALKQFVTDIEIKYPNTIFVLFADHCGGNISGVLENYMIPFAIYSKKLIQPKYYDTYLSQRDIAPTIYDMVIGNYKKSELSFSGKSLLQDTNFFADYYHNGILGWIEENNIIEINTATNKMQCFKIVNLDKETVTCNNIHSKLKNNALAFTNTSQDLLFSNKLSKFKMYRDSK